MSQSVRDKAMNRLKVARDIFLSKLSYKVVEKSNLKPQVAAICNYITAPDATASEQGSK